jgi:hypothetical protein
LKSVKGAGAEFKAKGWLVGVLYTNNCYTLRPLHTLILNGGVIGPSDSATADGFESHFGVNHLAGYYLTTLLIDVMLNTIATDKNDPLVGKRFYKELMKDSL